MVSWCVIILFTSLTCIPLLARSLNQQGLVLIRAKSQLDDPDSILIDWNPRDLTPCNWTGVRCHPDTHLVHSITISDSTLSGPLPASYLCRLTTLATLSLPNNFINSSLSPSHIAACRNLKHLDLSQNLLVGQIPETLSQLPHLLYLNLSSNNFSGQIPPSFSNFNRLETLVLTNNLLNGTIPDSLGNVTALKLLQLAYNPFEPGPLSADLGNLTNLEDMWLTDCKLSGPIPSTFARLVKLKNLDLSINNLSGQFPRWLPQLSSAVQVELYQNLLSGHLPRNMSNMTSLLRFDASTNSIDGAIPYDLCSLPLQSLHLYSNRLRGSLPESISISSNLYELSVFNNCLNGPLPADLGKNSPLKFLDVSENEFDGKIPAGLCSKGKLEQLLMIFNSISGIIPEEIGNCRSLVRLRLKSNRISGNVPSGIWGLPRLVLLDLTYNLLSGPVSPSISSASNLANLLISNNQFSGVIPSEIGSLTDLREFVGSNNKFTGEIPRTIVNLTQLLQLDLSDNELVGTIPNGIQSCKNLNELNLASNRLSGEIPHEIDSFPVLNYLDLSDNQFSGKIPPELQNMKLNKLNLSYNRLSGDIPPLYRKRIYRNGFLGNPELCPNIDGPCPRRDEDKRKSYLWMETIFIVVLVVFVLGTVWFYLKSIEINMAKTRLMMSKWRSFHKLGFSEFEIHGCLNEDNVIGCGVSGKVYKAVLSNRQVVAVKKICGNSRESSEKDVFEAEVETLGKIRHKNIVRLWCCFNGKDSKLLVYEYMPSGSLGDLLHTRKGSELLTWPTRYRIARDSAEGLSYLHHDCVPSIVHRDVKSNNILLDADFGARIADFGLAKIFQAPPGKSEESMSTIAGSYGYIAPEYAYTLRVTEKSDIYSFGVVILELVTGRLPVEDPEFGGDRDLVKWVSFSLENGGIENVLDPKFSHAHEREMMKVLDVGLSCTASLPMNRPSMRRVVKLLRP